MRWWPLILELELEPDSVAGVNSLHDPRCKFATNEGAESNIFALNDSGKASILPTLGGSGDA